MEKIISQEKTKMNRIGEADDINIDLFEYFGDYEQHRYRAVVLGELPKPIRKGR